MIRTKLAQLQCEKTFRKIPQLFVSSCQIADRANLSYYCRSLVITNKCEVVAWLFTSFQPSRLQYCTITLFSGDFLLPFLFHQPNPTRPLFYLQVQNWNFVLNFPKNSQFYVLRVVEEPRQERSTAFNTGSQNFNTNTYVRKFGTSLKIFRKRSGLNVRSICKKKSHVFDKLMVFSLYQKKTQIRTTETSFHQNYDVTFYRANVERDQN